MIFVRDLLCQTNKTGYSVCGDYTICERFEAGTAYVLCDGIGSGIYANLAAILCAERLMELIRLGTPLKESVELVAASMHRAREENIPFSAFSAAFIYPNGLFTVYTYEAPMPILLTDFGAQVLTARFHTAGYEMIAESEGRLQSGDSLILMSDGVTQSGMGRGYGLGIGCEGVANFINQNLKILELSEIPRKVSEYCASIANGRYEDDTTFALLHSQNATELTLLTGPPSRRSSDKLYAEIILQNSGGKKVVCGSTTIDVISRELGITVETNCISNAYGIPPEYDLEGVDLATEGAAMLNQVCNVIEEPPNLFEEDNSVKKLYTMLKESDVIHLHIGNAHNNAHDSLLFKQVGMRIRNSVITELSAKLRKLGKLVIAKYY